MRPAPSILLPIAVSITEDRFMVCGPVQGQSAAAAPGQAATPGAAAPAPGADKFAGRKDRRRTADDDDDDDSSAKKKGKKPDAKVPLFCTFP